MQITNQDFGQVFEPARTKTDMFMKIFLTIIIIIIEIVLLGVVTNFVIAENPTLDPLAQSIIVALPILLAIGIIFVIWKAEIIHDGDTVF
ncbi:MAG: hypothetical protein PVI03_01245 [Candidatus Thorarchaeota archaeon]|jgi:hypothetical protein